MIDLVLIHGWGCDSRTWQPLLESVRAMASVTIIDLPGFGTSPTLPDYSLNAVLDTLVTQLPSTSVVMGWSLGGMLAVQLAARFPERVRAVITLGANVKFVAGPDYSAAMPSAVNQQFIRSFTDHPPTALKLFCGLLAQGDAHERALLKQLRSNGTGPVTDNWLAALQLLTELDNRSAFAQITQPGLHLLADKDALVPVVAAELMKQINPQQDIEIISDTAHALHWSDSQAVIDFVAPFLKKINATGGTLDSPLDKKKVAQSFSRAAKTYDSVAQLQRDIGEQLFLQLPANLPAKSSVLDLGSGTGFFTRHLAAKYPQAQIVGLDIAEGMLHYAAEPNDGIHWLCSDAELLPIASESIDFIFSSLAIQWCNNLPQLMAELARVLKPGGQLHIATLGPHTLHELKSAWRTVDNYVHVNHFQSSDDLVCALKTTQLSHDAVARECRTLYYERPVDLTRELKALGAHNINSGKPGGLTGRSRLLAFKNAYELFRTPMGLPATYEVFYLSASKIVNFSH